MSKIIIDRAIYMHRRLGPGLLESVYEKILLLELRKAGLRCERQFPVDVVWDDEPMGMGFKADLIVEDKVIVELKSAERVHPVNFKQVLTYLRLTGTHLGLLINFNEKTLIEGYHRVVNDLPE